MPTIEDVESIKQDNTFIQPSGAESSSLIPQVNDVYQLYFHFLTQSDRDTLLGSLGYDILVVGEAALPGNQSMEYARFASLGTNQAITDEAANLFNLALGLSQNPATYLPGGYDYSVLFTDVVSNLSFEYKADATEAHINIGSVLFDYNGDAVGDTPLRPAATYDTLNVSFLNEKFPQLLGYDYSRDWSKFDKLKVHGDIWLNSGFQYGWTTTAAGSPQLSTIIHELGHALGLDHTFTQLGVYHATKAPLFGIISSNIDNQKYSIMSYTPLKGMNAGGADVVEPYGLQMYDIVALQDVFGTRN